MAKKEFTYRGMSLEEVKKLPMQDFLKTLTSRERRKFRRGLTPEEKKFLAKMRASQKPVKTHLREFVVLPELVGRTVQIYNGKDFRRTDILPEMIGHRLGEFAPTRTKVKHSSPGMGATRSSKYISLK